MSDIETILGRHGLCPPHKMRISYVPADHCKCHHYRWVDGVPCDARSLAEAIISGRRRQTEVQIRESDSRGARSDPAAGDTDGGTRAV